MLLQSSPNKWSCLPTSFAMALHMDVKKFIDLIGHDGSEIRWPEYPDPQCRRGFHPQECILIAYGLGVSVTHFARDFENGPHPFAKPVRQSLSDGDITNLLKLRTTVLTGLALRGNKHAVVTDGITIFDSNETQYPIKDFRIEHLFIIR